MNGKGASVNGNGSSGFGVRPARATDRAAVGELLRAADLPLAGVPDALDGFLVAEARGAVVGAVALERYGVHGLLRSAAVHPSHRGTGIGEALVRSLLDAARADGLQDIVLLTTTAERWFPRFGFASIPRGGIAPAVHASAELQGACPETAVAMKLMLR